jgi:hypothetical protein
VRGAFALLAPALTLCACAPKAAAPAGPLGLDCSLAFEAQSAKLTAQPGLKAAPKDYAEPYLYYSSDDGRVSYLITAPGAPGHPAIMMQRAAGGEVKTTGCPYGDRKGYDQLMKYLEGLKTWRR